jgi:hypothetical protein
VGLQAHTNLIDDHDSWVPHLGATFLFLWLGWDRLH